VNSEDEWLGSTDQSHWSDASGRSEDAEDSSAHYALIVVSGCCGSSRGRGSQGFDPVVAEVRDVDVHDWTNNYGSSRSRGKNMERINCCDAVLLPLDPAEAVLCADAVRVIHPVPQLAALVVVAVHRPGGAGEPLQTVRWCPVSGGAGDLLGQDVPLEGGTGRAQRVRQRDCVR